MDYEGWNANVEHISEAILGEMCGYSARVCQVRRLPAYTFTSHPISQKSIHDITPY